MLKKLISILLIVVILFASACRSGIAGQEDAGKAAEEEEDGFPVTVTDQAGRSVTIEKKPEKIVSGYYISTSALIALGEKDRLTGIEAKADKRNIYRLSAPELCDLPNVGSAKEFDLEGCAALKPDLVILPKKLKDAAETLTDMGIKVLLVDPESLEQASEMIRLLAEATGTAEKEKEISEYTEKIRKRVSEAVSGEEKPVVYMASNSDLLAAAGKSMYQADMIRLAGGENAADEIDDTYWVNVSYEQILSWDPDVIMLAAEASYTVEDVLNDPALQDVSAVKNGQIYAMPDKAEAWDSPVPGAVLGSVYTASLLHPEKMTEKECGEIIHEFYETFYGFDYDKE